MQFLGIKNTRFIGDQRNISKKRNRTKSSVDGFNSRVMTENGVSTLKTD